MGTVHRLASLGAGMSLLEAVSAYLATISHPESAGTERIYGAVLRRFAARFATTADLGDLDGAEVTEWFTGQWAGRAPDTWNTALSAMRAAAAYWADQDWLTTDPAAALRRRSAAAGPLPGLRPGRRRRVAHPRGHPAARTGPLADALRDRRPVGRGAAPGRAQPGPAQPAGPGAPQGRPARHDRVADRDRAAAPPPSQGPQVRPGVPDRTAGLGGTAARRRGPSQRPGPAVLPAGRGLVQSRHRRRDVAPTPPLCADPRRRGRREHTPMLQARSGHTSVRSLARYTRVSAEALARHQAERDPARRR